MLGQGCGMSQYPKCSNQHLEKYQLLPRPYLGSFEGDNGEKTIKEKWMSDLAGEDDFSWYFTKGMTANKYWKTLENS